MFTFSARTFNCSTTHPFAYDSGYSCCDLPLNILTRGFLRLYDPTNSCPKDNRIYCPGIPDGLCQATSIPGKFKFGTMRYFRTIFCIHICTKDVLFSFRYFWVVPFKPPCALHVRIPMLCSFRNWFKHYTLHWGQFEFMPRVWKSGMFWSKMPKIYCP